MNPDEPVSSVVHEAKMVRPMEGRRPAAPNMKNNTPVIVLVYLVLMLLGVGTGYLLAGTPAVSAPAAPGDTVTTSGSSKTIGSTDTTVFKDCPIGVIEKGGLDGEGTHKLIREGGPSQTAYLISSVIDLDEFVGTKVKACGQTLQAKKASWLLDIGRLELQ